MVEVAIPEAEKQKISILQQQDGLLEILYCQGKDRRQDERYKSLPELLNL